jgi:N-acetylglucosaminyldiphosphoundecaprenol N-acetyl-beta-D-mannosaminyltransferase
MSEFDRNVWCLLGIPIDVINFNQALCLITTSLENNTPCFFSTPNTNFIVEANKIRSFRNSVIRSDLVFLDGMPLVWAARLLRIPGIEKVSGSDLFESLCSLDRSFGDKFRIYLFGGENGVAEQACEQINASSAALECVGFHNPGFGTIEDMSDSRILDQINRANAEFVLVSLGAVKGQAWIMKNREKLNAPVISHLGAVINFTAGGVVRAPQWMQKAGLEWMWRILQEPVLWRRYLFDGLSFIQLFLGKVLPYSLWRLQNKTRLTETLPVTCYVDRSQEQITITIKGSCLHTTIGPLRKVFHTASVEAKPVKLDLSGVPVVDGAFLGLCLVLLKNVNSLGGKLTISGLSSNLKQIFRWNCVEYLL